MRIAPEILIDLIYKYCRQQNLLLPQITRLVKLMYLVELESYRQKRERLTDLEWRFHLYGPYPASFTNVLEEPEIEIFEWKAGKTSRQIVRDEEEFLGTSADFYLEAIVGRVVKDWGDADLNQLLDYVYFETEPMQHAKRGDVLDFSTVGPPIPKKIQISVNRNKLSELRRQISERAKAYTKLRQQSAPTADLIENLEIWDKEDAKRFPSGPCKIRLNDLVPEE